MEDYGRRLLAEICAWKNMAEGCWLSCVHGKYGRRLFTDMCVWRNKAEGCLVSRVHGRIWKKVVG
jgi:hypothetical protein